MLFFLYRDRNMEGSGTLCCCQVSWLCSIVREEFTIVLSVLLPQVYSMNGDGRDGNKTLKTIVNC